MISCELMVTMPQLSLACDLHDAIDIVWLAALDFQLDSGARDTKVIFQLSCDSPQDLFATSYFVR
jgi:hypothetical protein